MWYRALLAGACLAGLLTACAVVDPVDNRYDTVGRSLAKARNESIFLNLVRASHDYPLSFSVIGNVNPGITNQSTFGLPNFLIGPHIASYPGGGTVTAPLFSPGRDVIFNNTTASDSTSVTTNFQVSTQETSAFYQGFLRPIDLQTLAYFIRQGYPREMLFWLFTDSFQLTLGDKQYGYHYNPPDDYGCSSYDPRHRCFIDWVHAATLLGLTVEETTDEGEPRDAAAKGAGADKPGGKLGRSNHGTNYARFCLNRVLGQEAQATLPRELVQLQLSSKNLDKPADQLYQDQVVCGGQWTPPTGLQPDILPLQFFGGAINFTIVPRSAYGVFEFLGTLMKIEREHIAPADYAFIPPDRQYAAKAPFLETVHVDPHLINVLHELGGKCFVHTWFEDGDYCVPDEATTTKRIFGLLAQLIAIETAASDLSIVPLFRPEAQ